METDKQFSKENTIVWNPWHGCKKYSAGCKHCYVYRIDARHEKDASIISKNSNFNLPIRRKRNGDYHIKSNTLVYTCFSSDFFLEEADEWRTEAFQMMKERQDLFFLIITKRITRFLSCIPSDWGEGYPNVKICCTVENQEMADLRIPVYLTLPILHKALILEPLLSKIDLTPFLTEQIEEVIVGGESGLEARTCNYEWVIDIREQCIKSNISFYFKQTGANFEKDGKHYHIERKYQHIQAKKAGIDFVKKVLLP